MTALNISFIFQVTETQSIIITHSKHIFTYTLLTLQFCFYFNSRQNSSLIKFKFVLYETILYSRYKSICRNK